MTTIEERFDGKLESIGLTREEFLDAVDPTFASVVTLGPGFNELKFTEFITVIKRGTGAGDEYDDVSEPPYNENELKQTVLTFIRNYNVISTVTNLDTDYSDTLDSILQDTIGMSEAEFMSGIPPTGISLYDEHGELNLSRVGEVVNSLLKFKANNPDGITKEDLVEFIGTYIETSETLQEFYIYNNTQFTPIFKRLAMERDLLYNPIKPVAIVDLVCQNCGHGKMYMWQEQTRGSDEPLTTFNKCLSCRRRFQQ